MADPPDGNKLLHDILGALRSIRDEIHAIREDQQSAKDERNNEPFGISIRETTGLPVTVREHYESTKSEKRWNLWKKIRIGLEVIGFAGAVFAAIFTILTFLQIKSQSVSAQKQVTLMQRQFQTEQRPYMAVTSVMLTDRDTKKPSAPTIGKPLIVNLVIENVGKSSALNVIAHRHLIHGIVSMDQFKIEPADTKPSGDATAQGKAFLTTAVSMKDTFANEGVDILRSEVTNWDGIGTIVVFGRVTYEDAYKIPYCTPFAVRYIGPISWQNIMYLEGTRGAKSRMLTDLCPSGTKVY